MITTKLSKLAVRRLTKLADYMDSLPLGASKHFDMGVYYENDKDDFDYNAANVGKMECGTRACAAGWAGSRRRAATHGGHGIELALAQRGSNRPRDAEGHWRCGLVSHALCGDAARLEAAAHVVCSLGSA